MSDVRPVMVASFQDGATHCPLPVSERECLREEIFIRRVLEADSFEPGRCALVISTFLDAAHVIPLERVLMSRGLVVYNVKGNPYDGARVETIVRRFDVAAVFGVTATALEAIAAVGFDAATLFRGKRVWASGEGYAKLSAEKGIDLRRWETIGPVLAIEGRYGGGLHVDGREWLIEPEGDQVFVSSRLDRALTLKRRPFALRASLNPTPCVSGAYGPRIILQ